MRNYLSLLIVLFLSISYQSNAQVGNVLKKAKGVIGGGGLSQEDAGFGLKEALKIGVGEAVDQLSAKNGYLESPYKILLPEEARTIVSRVKSVPGFENVERDLILKMNEAAEISARKATPIFVDAITSITFDDALKILSGQDDAATRYLENRSYQSLYKAFMPVIQGALDEVKARDLWRSAVTAYNKIPLVKKTNPELDDHVNNMALMGLFSLIEKKERGIRNNADQRTTEILRKVFGS
ncbi:MAG TPA: DUF4197 domain-containing protein [Saprospiraceae bacterium]|nr:DUF4197 domain-containing protein [Saprospiraceae bacterium]